MFRIFSFILLFQFVTSSHSLAAQPGFLVAEQAVAVFNSPEAAIEPARPDNCGQTRALEFVAFPKTAFTVKRALGTDKYPLYEVTTSEYKAPDGVRLYVSGNGLRGLESAPAERQPPVLGAEEISKRLQGAIGLPYIWGGNLRNGIRMKNGRSQYAGVDCSGLLYEATGGYTPRNTAELVSFGRPVPVAGLGPDQIVAQLEPLDLIVWKGHLIIVLDKGKTIESALFCEKPGNGGVMTRPLRDRLGEVMSQRKGVDSWPESSVKSKLFVIRRWLQQPL